MGVMAMETDKRFPSIQTVTTMMGLDKESLNEVNKKEDDETVTVILGKST